MAMGIAKPQQWPANEEQFQWMIRAMKKKRKEARAKRIEENKKFKTIEIPR
jgi:hypothetical protein